MYPCVIMQVSCFSFIIYTIARAGGVGLAAAIPPLGNHISQRTDDLDPVAGSNCSAMFVLQCSTKISFSVSPNKKHSVSYILLDILFTMKL